MNSKNKCVGFIYPFFLAIFGPLVRISDHGGNKQLSLCLVYFPFFGVGPIFHSVQGQLTHKSGSFPT